MATTLHAESTGHSIAYDIVGHGPCIVLICGVLSDRTSWHRFGYVERLAESHRVVTLDPLGHGQSSKPHHTVDYTKDRLVDHVLAVLDAEAIETATLWGYSRGGNIAALTTWREPDRVDTLVLGGTPMTGGSSWPPAALASLARGDWEGCWASFPIPLSDEIRHRMESGNDPIAVAAAVQAGSDIDFPWTPFARPAIGYVGDGEEFADINRKASSEIGLPMAVLPTGGHPETFAASNEILALVKSFI